MAKKVQFGVKDLTVWALTETTTTTGITVSYGDAIAIPGTVKIQLDPAGSDATPFYADDSTYWITNGKNQGYTGSFDNALIPEKIRTDLMNYIKDSNNNLVEIDESDTKYFGMAFSKESNDGDIRFVFYKCAFGRLSVNGDTTTDTQSPETETASVTIVPLSKKYTLGGKERTVISNMTSDSTTTASFSAWFTTPQLPGESIG